MDRFTSVLVLLNAEVPLPAKLDTAVRLARRNGAPLTLFDAVETPRRRWPLTGDDAMTEQLVATRRGQLDEIAAALDHDRVEVVVRAGDAIFAETIQEVAEGGHDIVVTAPDEPGRARLVGAPTAMHLLRKCPVPVWVQVEGAQSRRGVVAAVGPFFDDTRELNRTLLELAASMAARDDEPLHVMHAWRLPGETLLRSRRSGTPAEEVDRMAAEAHEAARDGLESLVAEVVPDDVTTTTHLVKGMPGEVVPRLIDGIEPRALVLGTLSRTGIRGLIVGNTAEKVLDSISCSVLAVKPPGFVSPVLA